MTLALTDLGLTEEQQKARDGRLTASRVGVLMNGSPEDIHNLWLEMIGQREPDDLSGNFYVVLGQFTEPLNLAWIERREGIEIGRRGESVVQGWASCTLDGCRMSDGIPVDAKHVNGFQKIEDVTARYWPQMHWQMFLTGALTSLLSVIRGTNEPELVPIPWDQGYFDELWQRAEAFMECVNSLTPPEGFEPKAPPIEAAKEYDLTGNNEWASAAADWLGNKEAAAVFEKAKKALKDAVPDDAKRAFGHGVEVNRSKAGALTPKEMKE